MKRLLLILTLALSCNLLSAQSKIVKDFTPVCDSLATLIQERCGVEGKLKVKSIMRRGTSLDFYFTESLGDFPWNKSDIKWFRTTLKSLFLDKYRQNRLGEIYSRKVNLDRLAMPALTYDGQPAETISMAKLLTLLFEVTELFDMETRPELLMLQKTARWNFLSILAVIIQR